MVRSLTVTTLSQVTTVYQSNIAHKSTAQDPLKVSEFNYGPSFKPVSKNILNIVHPANSHLHFLQLPVASVNLRRFSKGVRRVPPRNVL